MSSVFKTDLTDGKIFHGVGFVIPVGPGVADIAGFVAQIGPAVAAGGHRFGRTHKLPGTFKDMHTDVDHRSAALKFFLTENAPVGNAPAAESLTLDKHNVAEASFIPGLDQSLGLPAEGKLFTDPR